MGRGSILAERASRMDKLNPGERFPHLTADAVDGSQFTVPDDLEGIRAVLLFYRGHW